MDYDYFELGNEAFDEGNFKEAIKHYKNAIELDSEMIGAWQNLALAYFEEGNFRESINISNEILSFNNQVLWHPLYNRGNCFHEIKEYEKAESDFSEIIEHFPDHSLAYFNRANAREKLGNARGAKEDREMVNFLEPGNKKQNLYKSPNPSEIEDYTLEKFTIEKSNLLSELALNPNSYSLYFELGNAYTKIREFNKAIDSFKKAIELYPEEYYEDAYQNLIATYYDIEEYKEVVKLADEFIKQNSEVSHVKAMRIWALQALEITE